jgi:hypothetical protein
LDALGTQLNLVATVDGTINDWFRFFYDSWFDFSKLKILTAQGGLTDPTVAGSAGGVSGGLEGK